MHWQENFTGSQVHAHANTNTGSHSQVHTHACIRKNKKKSFISPLYENVVFICRLIPLLTEKVGNFLGSPYIYNELHPAPYGRREARPAGG